MATTTFSSSSDDERVKRQCVVVTVELGSKTSQHDNLKVFIVQYVLLLLCNNYIQPWKVDEILHATASLCSACLPDMEVSAIYNSLTTCTTIIALASPQGNVRTTHIVDH